MTNEKLEEICWKIYRELYRNTKPKADLDELIESGATGKSLWFLNYYLPQEKQNEITDKILNKYKLSKYEKKKIREEIALGFSPRGIKESVSK